LQLDKLHFTLTSFLRYQQAQTSGSYQHHLYQIIGLYFKGNLRLGALLFMLWKRAPAFAGATLPPSRGGWRYFFNSRFIPRAGGLIAPRVGALIGLEFPQSGKVFTAECAEDAEIFNFVFFSTVSACSAVNPAIRLAGGNV
jgi:hypothetical protein